MRNTLLQSIQQPLPQAILATTTTTATTTHQLPAVTATQQLPVQTTGSRPAPLTVTSSVTNVNKNTPQTPLSADMEDAESQISFLLESLQKQQQQQHQHQQNVVPGGGNSVNSDQDFLDSLTSPHQVTPPSSKPESFSKPSRFPSPQMPVLQPQMPILQPQVSVAESGPPPLRSPHPPGLKSPHDSSFSNSNKHLDSLSRSQISDKKHRHESGGMPLLSPTTGILHSPGTSPRAPHVPSSTSGHVAGGVIQVVPKHGDTTQVCPNVTVQTPVSSPSSSSGGGSVSQLRALQQLPLPPNTR